MKTIFAYVVDVDSPTPEGHQETIMVLVDGDAPTGGPLQVLDEGVEVTADATSIDFVGDCVAASAVDGAVMVVVECGSATGGPTGGPEMEWATGDGSTAISTSSTSMVDMTSMTVVIAASSGDKLMMTFDATTHDDSTAATFIALAFNVGGTDLVPWQVGKVDENSNARVMSHPHLVQSGDVSGGNVTVKVRWRVDNGTGHVINETGGLNRRPVLTVVNNH